MILFWFILLLIYGIGIILLLTSFFNLKKDQQWSEKDISLIIPVRNEEERIETILESLLSNQFENSKVLFVNDHSTDDTVPCITRKGFKVIDLPIGQEGKKAALIYGVNSVSTEYILFNDADVKYPMGYEKLLSQVPFNGDFDVCILPVEMRKESGFLNKLIQFDFAFLQFLTYSFRGNLGNGANLLVRRQTYLEMSNGLQKEFLSGDDYFLIKECRKRSKVIKYMRSPQYRISTDPPKSIRGLLEQRGRWFHKTLKTNNHSEILNSVLFILISLAHYFFIVIYAITSEIQFIYLFIFKFGIDLILFIVALYFIKRLRLLYLLPLMTFLYPIYYISVVLKASKKLKWKDRDL